MAKNYPYLLCPLKVRGMVLKNRMTAATSLPHFLMGPEPYFPRHMINLMANRAKNGAAVVTLSHTYAPFGEHGMKFGGDTDHFPVLDMYDTTCQNYLIQLCDAVHFYESKACLNITRPNMREWNVVDDPRRGAKAYTPEIIDKFIDGYVEQALIAKKLGFDMCSIHFAYRSPFAGAFLSPLTNTRTDEYGGSLENRAKVVLEIFRRVKAAVGEDFPLEGLMSAVDLPGGYTLEDTKQFAKMSEGLIDILQLRMPDADPSHPMGFHEPMPTLPYAAELKSLGLKTIIEPIGGYTDPDDCEAVLREGKADLIGMARNWIANDHYGEYIRQGRADDITPCIRCNKCHVISHDQPYRSACSVNPAFGIQTTLDQPEAPLGEKQKIAVVGGGPAGMEAAVTAAKRGHSVTLYEKSAKLGGQLKAASVPDFKWPVKKFTDFMVYQTNKNGIDLRLNTAATREMLEAEGFDTVICALGAEPVMPKVKGLDTVDFLTAQEALEHPEKVSGRVVILGGGEVGVETGIFFGRKGHSVTVLGRNAAVAPEVNPIHYRETFDKAWQELENLTVLTSAPVTELGEGFVRYEKDGEEHTVEADTVVLAAGMRSLCDEALAFYSDKYDFHMVGDCKKTGSIMTAMRGGWSVASQL